MIAYFSFAFWRGGGYRGITYEYWYIENTGMIDKHSDQNTENTKVKCRHSGMLKYEVVEGGGGEGETRDWGGGLGRWLANLT